MQITTLPETPEAFTIRVAEVLNLDTTHVYFDTSFLMWLTRVGEEARSQFFSWAATLENRTHIPLWSMHEFYRHHTGGTLRADLVHRVDDLLAAARAFQNEVRKYADQALFPGQSEAAYQDSVDNALETLREIGDAAKAWDYDRCASTVIEWMNTRACKERTVFDSIASLGAKGAVRYTQDIPPGFLDRRKEDTPTRGSNRFGDLLFWEEVVQHAKSVDAAAVVVVTRDRKPDWFDATSEPQLEHDWKKVKAKWLPVPNPHPTLAFELKVETNAQLLLLDELYLGALLWKFERPKFERLAAVAISVSPGHFDKVDPAPRPVKSRASKRHEQTTLGLQDVGLLLDAASNGPTERVATLLARFNQDAPDLDDFIDQLGVGTLEPLSPNEIANFTRLLHDKAKDGAGPVVAAAGKLLNITDAMPANMAAASYTGFMMSAYFADGSPAPRPTSPFIEDLFAWQGDLAMKRVLKVLGMRLHNLRSPALYVPDGKEQRLTLLVEHD
ncbi:MAG: PIN-like domain-containing protein, partial [Rhodospirillales bacterium]